jgi:hypothetical protein
MLPPYRNEGGFYKRFPAGFFPDPSISGRTAMFIVV